MIVISDVVSKKLDEGYLKIVFYISKKLKEDGAYIISFTDSEISNFVCNRKGIYRDKKLKNKIKKDNVLFIPQGNNSWRTILYCILFKYFFNAKKITLFFVQVKKNNILKKIFFKFLDLDIVVLSKKSIDEFSFISKKIKHLKFGVDINKFKPVDVEQKKFLRRKYGIPEEETVLLHIGHLKYGRNVHVYSNLEKFYKLLVVSSSTKEDIGIREDILKKKDIGIIDYYVEKIEEIYQLSDCYIFLVENNENCIDIPLSVLEACSTNLPVVSTNYSDMINFSDDSFIIINNLNIHEIENAVKKVLNYSCVTNRKKINEYDWSFSIQSLKNIVDGIRSEVNE